MENLVGGEAPMLDQTIRAFANDPGLGLVYPEDPHLQGWDLNRDIADELAIRLDIDLPDTKHFDFPIGGMFWARPAALRPMIDAHFDWEDYPSEPLPIDGTMLHALERLVPFSATDSGFSTAKTYLPNVSRL